MGPTGAGPICATEYNKWHDQNLTSKKVRGLLGSHPFPCLLRTRLCRTGAAGSTVQSSGGLQGLNFTNADFLHGGRSFRGRQQPQMNHVSFSCLCSGYKLKTPAVKIIWRWLEQHPSLI